MKTVQSLNLSTNTVELLRNACRTLGHSMSEVADALLARMLSGLTTEQISGAVTAMRAGDLPQAPADTPTDNNAVKPYGRSTLRSITVSLTKSEDECVYAFKKLLEAFKDHEDEMQRGRRCFSLAEIAKAVGVFPSLALHALRGLERKQLLNCETKLYISGPKKGIDEGEHWDDVERRETPEMLARWKASRDAADAKRQAFEAAYAASTSGIV